MQFPELMQGHLSLPLESQANYYNKQYEQEHLAPGQPRQYIRSTINSKHTNGYENYREQRREPKVQYQLIRLATKDSQFVL